MDVINRLKLNTDKTQFIWLGSRQQLQKVRVNAVHLGTDVVNFQTTVGNLGVTIDSQMTMTAHVRRICRTSFYQLRQLRTVRRSLSSEACTTLVHAFVTIRLDYCNSLLAGISNSLLLQLQSVLRIAARLVMRKGKFDPISDDIRDHPALASNPAESSIQTWSPGVQVSPWWCTTLPGRDACAELRCACSSFTPFNCPWLSCYPMDKNCYYWTS